MKDTANVEEKLIESFKELVMREPVEKITIKEIADGAGVIRTTFYYHFQDKYELIERIIQQNLVDPIMSLLQQGHVDEALLELFRRLDQERLFYKRLARMEGQNSFEEILNQNISAGLLEAIQRLGLGQRNSFFDKYEWLTPKFVSDYYAKTITFALITFLNTEPPAAPEEAAEVFDYVLRHRLSETLEELYPGYGA